MKQQIHGLMRTWSMTDASGAVISIMVADADGLFWSM